MNRVRICKPYRAGLKPTAQYMKAPSGLTTRNEHSESASADFHALRQGFSPPKHPLDPEGAFKRLMEGLESLKK